MHGLGGWVRSNSRMLQNSSVSRKVLTWRAFSQGPLFVLLFTTGGTRIGPRSWIRHHHCGSLDGPVGNSSSQQAYSPIQGPRRWRIVDQLSFEMDQSITWPEMSWSVSTTRSSLPHCLSLLKNNLSETYSSSSWNKGNCDRDPLWISDLWFLISRIFMLLFLCRGRSRIFFYWGGTPLRNGVTDWCDEHQ